MDGKLENYVNEFFKHIFRIIYHVLFPTKDSKVVGFHLWHRQNYNYMDFMKKAEKCGAVKLKMRLLATVQNQNCVNICVRQLATLLSQQKVRSCDLFFKVTSYVIECFFR